MKIVQCYSQPSFPTMWVQELGLQVASIGLEGGHLSTLLEGQTSTFSNPGERRKSHKRTSLPLVDFKGLQIHRLQISSNPSSKLYIMGLNSHFKSSRKN